MEVDKSANIELCVICRSFLKLKIQIGQTRVDESKIFDSTRGNESQIANFRFPSRGPSRF